MRLSIKSLPPELLSQIFISCLPENPCFSPLFSPLLLTQVCHYWRVVALETHELWSTIMIRNHAMKRRDILSLLDLWLKRSGTRPLDVFLDIYFIDDLVSTLIMQEFTKRQEEYRTLLKHLSPHLGRIRKVQGCIPVSIVPDLRLELMDSLETLEIVGTLDIISSMQPLHLEVLKLLPKLRTVSLENLGLDQSLLSHQTQITRLELSKMRNPTWMSCRSAYNILKSLPELQTVYLDLNRSDEPEGPDDNSGNLLLPNLQALYISWENWQALIDPEPLLRSIFAPNLRKLALSGELDRISHRWEALRNFIVSSNYPPLTHLAICETGPVDLCLDDILKCTPELTHLIIAYGPALVSFLRKLEWNSSKPEEQLCPKLSALHICDELVSIEVIWPILQSRRNTIKKVIKCQCLHFSDEDWLRIKNLGITVSPPISGDSYPFPDECLPREVFFDGL